jgi:hypothetical protein
MAEAEDLKSFQCGFESHRVYVNDFSVVNIETGAVDSTHSSYGFKRPYVEGGNLHWFSYAADQVTARISRRNLDKIILGYYDEWCANHKFTTQQPTIMEAYVKDFKMTEFEFIAPVIKEGTIHEVHSGG